MPESGKREERHQRIRTALAVAGALFKVLWTMFDPPRHL